jgi:hypothetical protein
MVSVAHGDVSTVRLSPRAQLVKLSLPERCALHRLLAQSFVDVRDLLRLSTRTSDLSRLAFVVIVDDGEAPGSGLLLRAGERCQPLQTRGSFWSGAIEVRFAADSPPSDALYQWLRLEGGDGRRFRFVRELYRLPLQGCVPSQGQVPGLCGGHAEVSAALPTLVIDVERQASVWVERRVELEWGIRSEGF